MLIISQLAIELLTLRLRFRNFSKIAEITGKWIMLVTSWNKKYQQTYFEIQKNDKREEGVKFSFPKFYDAWRNACSGPINSFYGKVYSASQCKSRKLKFIWGANSGKLALSFLENNSSKISFRIFCTVYIEFKIIWRPSRRSNRHQLQN